MTLSPPLEQSPHGGRSLQGLVWYSSCKDIWVTTGVHRALQEESEGPQGLHSSCISMDLQDGQRSVGAESSLKLHRYSVKMKTMLLMLV